MADRTPGGPKFATIHCILFCETDDDWVNGFVPVVASEHTVSYHHILMLGKMTDGLLEMITEWQDLWWLYFSEIASSHDQF